MKNNIGQQHKSVRAAAAIVIDKVLRCSQTASHSTTPTNSNKRSLLNINEHCEQGSNEAASQNATINIDSSSLALQQGAPARAKRSLLSINEHCEQGSNEAASQNATINIDSSSLALQQGAPARAKRSLLSINEHCEQGSNEAASQNATINIDSSSLALQQGAPARAKRSLLSINEHCEQGSNEAASQNATINIDSSSLALQQGAPAVSKRSLLSINEHCEQGSNEAASQNAKSISDKKTLDTILTNTLNNVPKRDQALLQELCYGCLRWYHQHNYLLNKLLSKPLKHQDNIVLALLLLGIYQLQHTRIPHYAAIAATVDAARELNVNWAVKLINAVLRNFLRQRQTLTQSLTKNSSVSSVYSHPLWLINALQKAWPQHWQEILTANNQHPPLHLRVNLQVTTRADYLQLLTQHNIVAKATPFTTGGILLSQPCPVTKLPNFAEGWVSVQDSAAQLATELLELKPKMNVLDACAAPGGKLTHILETENNLASVVGVEIDKIRLTKIQENLQRLFRSQTNFQSTSQRDTPYRDMSMEPLFHINKHGEQEHNFSPRQNATMQLTLINNDASKPQLWWQQPHKKFQRILLDAPCSATGVIRRHPDIKILRQPNDIAKFAAKQLDILNALWPLLDINGILLYCTCSILPEENWLTIERFLSQHQDAHHETINAKWGIAVKFGRQILPGMDNMDGLYYAKISKKK